MITLTRHQTPGQPVGQVIPLQAINPIPEVQTVPRGQTKPLITIDGRNLDTMRAAVAELHKRYNPPRLDDDEGESYWAAWAADAEQIMKRFDCDPFLMDELLAAVKDLEREYKFLLAQVGAGYETA